jgi:hypothetical protein
MLLKSNKKVTIFNILIKVLPHSHIPHLKTQNSSIHTILLSELISEVLLLDFIIQNI